jgi:hypothetical protein
MKDSFWVNQTPELGSEALFRGQFRLVSDSCVRICMVGASWYQAWIDGKWLLEGKRCSIRQATEGWLVVRTLSHFIF